MQAEKGFVKYLIIIKQKFRMEYFKIVIKMKIIKINFI